MILSTIACAASSVSASAIPSENSGSSLVQRDLKTCPALNNYIWTSPSGATQWRIGCNRDTETNGDRTEIIDPVEDLEKCIKICGDGNHHGWCKSVSWPGGVNSPGPCYLKGGNSGARIERTGWKLAIKL